MTHGFRPVREDGIAAEAVLQIWLRPERAVRDDPDAC